MPRSLFVLTLLAALGSGLMAGLFFAFSTSVMSALGRLPPSGGIAAMQAINVTIINPVFLGVFLGTAVLSALLVAAALLGWAPGAMAALLAGGVLYLAGCILVTMSLNVPLNNALAAVNPASSEGAAFWTRYLSTWTLWNHVRMLACLAATAAFALALRGLE